jgi:hypothetical protein
MAHHSPHGRYGEAMVIRRPSSHPRVDHPVRVLEIIDKKTNYRQGVLPCQTNLSNEIPTTGNKVLNIPTYALQISTLIQHKYKLLIFFHIYQ